MIRRLFSCVFAMLLATTTLQAQNQNVTGTVVSAEDGQPVVGASVVVVGTRQGTLTDVDGRFTLPSLPATAKKVKVTYLGMQPAEVAIKPQMKITLRSNANQLDEVMVVAYGTAKKSSYAGSASMVGSSDLKDLPSSTFENALNGKVAGLQVTNASGQVGSAPVLHIRGIGSMNASNEPLYVIDGVPVVSGSVGQMSDNLYTSNNVMSSLNPEDIESVSVLKDAAASSLYGSRAANGVVIITTKRGKTGRPQVEFKASLGFTPSWATDNYEPASTQHQIDMLYTVLHNYAVAGQGKSDADATAYALRQLNKKFNKHGYAFTTNGTSEYENVIISDYDNSGRAEHYYDWDDAYYRTGAYQSYDISASGAGDATNYYTSISYTKDQGRLKVNNFERFSGRVNLNQKIGRHFEVGTNVSLGRTVKNGYNDSRNTSGNYFFQTRNLLWGFYWPTDYKTGEEWTARYGSYARNNLYYDKQWENKSTNTNISVIETLTAHIIEGLDLKTVFSYDNTSVRDHLYYSATHFNGSSTNGSVDEMRTTYEKFVSSTTATYNHSFGDHSIGLLAGFEAEKNKTDFTRATGENLPTSALHTVSTAGTLSSAGYNWGNSMMSWLSKADYNYQERYFASASFRRDGSSRLSPDTRWGNFWSVAGAWRISQEAFLKDNPVVSDLRLRASYGVNGTLPSSNYGYMNLISYASKYMGNPCGTITTLANRDLSWETSHTVNVGLDFGFFGQRLRSTIEFFNRESKNLLQDVPVSMTTGFTSTLQNVGNIRNRGVDVEFSGEILKRNGWLWTASANASFLSSKVTKLYDGEDIIWYDPTGGDSRAQYIYREGESTLAFYGYEWAGVDPTNGKSVYYVNGDAGETGDFTFNGRAATYDYNKANYTIIGNAIPDVQGGFSTNVSWKGIELGLNFIYKIGGDLYDGAYKDVADDGYYWERIHAQSYYEDMWTPTHTSGTQPALSGLDLTDAIQYSTRHISDASFLRLKTLTLAYSLPRKIISNIGLTSTRFFFNASNLLTWAKYKEADPEVNQYGTRGWETPIGKIFVFGVDIKF